MTRQLALLPAASSNGETADEERSTHGEVFTRRWVVELILDLVGYDAESDLAERTIIEPACGTGAFLVPIVERLVASCRRHGRDPARAMDAIRAFDLLEPNVELTRTAVAARLIEHGVAAPNVEMLVSRWIAAADFLLDVDEPESADFVVGNPPYIRLEDVPRPLTAAYREACPTMRGRSDIYVGFIEKGLRMLRRGGRLGFICADRWMYNHYGRALRKLISERYAVETVVTMHDVDAFEDEVSAYPAITILRSGPHHHLNVVDTESSFGPSDAQEIRRWVGNGAGPVDRTTFRASRIKDWQPTASSWPSGTPAQREIVADLEHRFRPLADPMTGTKVGIGVATGCDEVYITTDTALVEPDRLLPLLLAKDTANGTVAWSGHYLVNPWENGRLVDLARFPRLRAYLETNAGRLRARHVARKRPDAWYRTIDRVDPTLQQRPKLVFPDIKAEANPVLDPGNHYPHHNLYFIVSDTWDLEVLGGLLLSDVATLFVAAYSVRMRGGYYRFQAQYLRRIRIPAPDEVDHEVAKSLAAAFRSRDRRTATALACELYELDEKRLAAALRS